MFADEEKIIKKQIVHFKALVKNIDLILKFKILKFFK